MGGRGDRDAANEVSELQVGLGEPGMPGNPEFSTEPSQLACLLAVAARLLAAHGRPPSFSRRIDRSLDSLATTKLRSPFS